MDPWNPSQYERFRAERRQPFDDLLALVERRPLLRVVDLGCGTGEATRDLHRALQAASTLGLDRSARMLQRARAFEEPGLTFVEQDIGALPADARFDLIFSNAALQWLPDHPALIARLTHAVAENGQLAFQVPASGHPARRVAADVAATEPFRSALGGWTRQDPVLAPEEYARLLHRLGYRRQHVRLQIYPHILPDRDAVLEWVKGTLLTAYEERLAADLYPAFLDAYRARLLDELEDARPFFYPFARILCWAGR
ncbi:MAG TPA: methyltransferase domain-containing protein [Vicinamibacterales bacterium]|nr:methyltransferase domain-containing protein [Vicinamibacterales bacterium]